MPWPRLKCFTITSLFSEIYFKSELQTQLPIIKTAAVVQQKEHHCFKNNYKHEPQTHLIEKDNSFTQKTAQYPRSTQFPFHQQTN